MQISKGSVPDNGTWKLPKEQEFAKYGFTTENRVGSWSNGWNFNNGKFLPASGTRRAADGQLDDSGVVGYYWVSDYFTIVDGFGKQYWGMGIQVKSDGVTHRSIYHSAFGFQIRCVRQ